MEVGCLCLTDGVVMFGTRKCTSDGGRRGSDPFFKRASSRTIDSGYRETQGPGTIEWLATADLLDHQAGNSGGQHIRANGDGPGMDW